MSTREAANEASAATGGPFLDAAAETPQAWDRLAAYLAAHGFKLTLEPSPRQFALGFGNLNYLIRLDGKPQVLRRPPIGPIPPGANDMRREHTILSVLWQVFPLAPRSIHYCPDPEVIGAHFLIMEYRPGLSVGGEMPARLAHREGLGERLAGMLMDILGDLHAVDPKAIGLGAFRRPDGFLGRAVEGWRKRMTIATDDAPPAVGLAVSDWLRAHQAPEQTPVLLHNDFKLDNVLLDRESLEPVAVVDWDQGTRGDPLFDLATLLSYWTEADDPPAMQALRQMPTAGHGFPRRAEIVKMYAARTGRDVSDFAFHRVLAIFKLSVVFMQIHAQYRRGTSTDERFARFGEITDGLMEFALDVAMGRAF